MSSVLIGIDGHFRVSPPAASSRPPLRQARPRCSTSDTYQLGELATRDYVLKVSRGAGLSDEDTTALLGDSPRNLLARLEATRGR